MLATFLRGLCGMGAAAVKAGAAVIPAIHRHAPADMRLESPIPATDIKNMRSTERQE